MPGRRGPKPKEFEGSIDEYIALLQDNEARRIATLMEGWSATPVSRPPRYKRVVVPLGEHRFVYVRRGTRNREVRDDGSVWCTDHNERLREYNDRRGRVQRKCRSCANEYQRKWVQTTAKGQQYDVNDKANARRRR